MKRPDSDIPRYVWNNSTAQVNMDPTFDRFEHCFSFRRDYSISNVSLSVASTTSQNAAIFIYPGQSPLWRSLIKKKTIDLYSIDVHLFLRTWSPNFQYFLRMLSQSTCPSVVWKVAVRSTARMLGHLIVHASRQITRKENWKAATAAEAASNVT